jgi:toxin ParE1/3/4
LRKLVRRARALEDLQSIIEYIAERNAPAARRPHSAIGACAERLRERPSLYRAGRVEGTREAAVHPKYILVYEAGAEAVEITAVVHARRRYP